MGWDLSWRATDSLKDSSPRLLFLPIILRCPQDICIERIRQRHLTDPDIYGPPELFENSLSVQTYLDRLARPDVRSVGAGLPLDIVYAAVSEYVLANLPTESAPP
jgi:hypothetical protein